jgi:hypothetical protein
LGVSYREARKTWNHPAWVLNFRDEHICALELRETQDGWFLLLPCLELKVLFVQLTRTGQAGRVRKRRKRFMKDHSGFLLNHWVSQVF